MNPDEEKTNVITPAADPTTQPAVPDVPAPDITITPTGFSPEPTTPTAPDLDATGDAPSQSFDQAVESPEVVSTNPAGTAPTSVTPPDTPSAATSFAPDQPIAPPTDPTPAMPVEQPAPVAPAEQKSGSKAVIVVLLAVILISAGATVAYFGGLFG